MVEHLLESNKKFAEGKFSKCHLVQQIKNTFHTQRIHSFEVTETT